MEKPTTTGQLSVWVSLEVGCVCVASGWSDPLACMGCCSLFLDAHAAGIRGMSGRRSRLVWKYRARS